MRFITSKQLNTWADSRECQSMLPELIKRLIYASTQKLERLTIPSGDDVHLPGWDGVVESSERFFTIDEGISLWEIGCDKNVSAKINLDYTKRDADPLGFDKAFASFVFVTPRYWSGSTKWVEETRQNAQWKNIVVLTAVELEDWVNSHPAVGIWLAEKFGYISPQGLYLPEDFWKLWAHGKASHLRPDLLLGAREEAVQKLKEFVQDEPSVVHVEALSHEEALAFSVAFCLSIKDETPQLLSNAIVVLNQDLLIRMSNSYLNLIFITTVPNIPYEITRRGHYVISAVSPADEINNAITLPIIAFDKFVKSLSLSGIDESQARALAHDTLRDVMALRRRLEIDTLNPYWAQGGDLVSLLPALVVGRWNSSYDGDKKLIELLGDAPYDNLEQKLIRTLHMSDCPFVKIDSVWRSRSPYEAVRYTLSLFTQSFWNRFCNVVKEAFADDDSDAVDKINTPEIMFWEHKQKVSLEFKKGICQTLTLLTIHNSNDWQPRVNAIVAELLSDFTLKRYLSCRHFFTMIAEASPSSTLSFLEAELNKCNDFVKELFITRKDNSCGISSGRIYYSELLWALEAIAWDEQYLLRCSQLLMRLCNYPKNENYINNPINSIKNIFRFVLPQTYVEVKRQDEVLMALMRFDKENTCDLILNLLNDLSQRSFLFSRHYKWRLFNHRRSPKYINPVSAERINVLCELMLKNIDLDSDKACRLINISFMPELRQCIGLTIVNYLSNHVSIIRGDDNVCDELRDSINHHISYNDAKWAMNMEELQPYQLLLSDLLSDEVVEQHKWLFKDSYVEIPFKWNKIGKERHDALIQFRQQAIYDIIQNGGYDSIVRFSNRVDSPYSLGESFYLADKASNLKRIITDYSEHLLSFDFLFGYGYKYFLEYGTSEIINVGKTIESLDIAVDWFCVPRYQSDIACFIKERMPTSAQARYWGKVQFCDRLTNELDNIIRNLLAVNRSEEALKFLYFSRNEGNDLVSNQMKLDYLSKILTTDITINPYFFIEVIEAIDKTSDPDIINKIIHLELSLYPLFISRMDTSKLRIVQEALLKPEVMIDIISLAYLPEEDIINDEKDVSENNEITLTLSRHAFSLLHDLHSVPFIDNDNADIEGLKGYIINLRELAVERKRILMTNHTIGHLLANIPENEDYPPEYLSEIIEQLSDDAVDESFRIQMSNKRGVTIRSLNIGGEIERRQIERYQRYAEKTRFSFPRITKVFNELIDEYRFLARREDNEAMLLDLE